MQQCLTLEDDVAKIMRHELQGTIISWGACSLVEVSKECRWHQLDDKTETYCADTIVGRWLEHVSLHVSVVWERWSVTVTAYPGRTVRGFTGVEGSQAPSSKDDSSRVDKGKGHSRRSHHSTTGELNDGR